MEEKILEIIESNISYVDDGSEISQSGAAREITAHVMEFMQWVVENCRNDRYRHSEQRAIDGQNHVVIVYEDKWFIREDVNEWNGEPANTFSNEQLYSRWLTNIKK